MSYLYNIKLTREQIDMICNALNTEGKRFGTMAHNALLDLKSKTPRQTVDIWENASGDHFALTSGILLQRQNIDKYGHGIEDVKAA